MLLFILGGTMHDLNDLIVSASGWVLNSANAINDLGQIVGNGTNPSGQTHAFLLNPVQTLKLSVVTNTPGVPIVYQLSGPSGLAYSIQTSTNLATTNWLGILTLTNVTGTVNFSDTNSSGYPMKFYRALQL